MNPHFSTCIKTSVTQTTFKFIFLEMSPSVKRQIIFTLKFLTTDVAFDGSVTVRRNMRIQFALQSESLRTDFARKRSVIRVQHQMNSKLFSVHGFFAVLTLNSIGFFLHLQVGEIFVVHPTNKKKLACKNMK